MRKILISINPEHVENIFSGLKKFEYRTRVAKKDIDSIIIYSTFPEKKVVGEAKIKKILAESPDVLWEKTKEHSGITKDFFDLYFKSREVAYAYELCDIVMYKEPKMLENFGISFAPQSFVYV